jgi:hypothetical protein
MKKIIAVSCFVFITLFLLTKGVLAQTISVEVSGNGNNSQNVTNVTVQEETVINQTNQSNITNDVSVNTNTGSNNASANTGQETQIATGDSNTNLDIQNQANLSAVNLSGCDQCQNNVNIQIGGNGESSQNSINANITNQTEINVLNDAEITNKVNINGNTGLNEASKNNGDVAIKTGDISVRGSLENRANYSEIIVDPWSGQKVIVINSSNGANSVNDLNISILQSLNITKIDREVIENLIDIILNTGGNIASDNNGSVSIETGDIDVDFSVVNDVNKDYIKIECCKEPPEGGPVPEEPPIPPQPPVVPPPVQPGPFQPGPSEAGPAGPQAPGQVLGLAHLPVTGPASFLFLVLLWLLLLAAGLFLRYRGERAPPKFFIVG